MLPDIELNENLAANRSGQTRRVVRVRETVIRYSESMQLQTYNEQIKKRKRETMFPPVNLVREPAFRIAAASVVRFRWRSVAREADICNRDLKQWMGLRLGRSYVLNDLTSVIFGDIAGEVFMSLMKCCYLSIWHSEQVIEDPDAVGLRNIHPFETSFLPAILNYIKTKAVKAALRCLGPFRRRYHITYFHLLSLYGNTIRTLIEDWDLVHHVAENLASVNSPLVCPDQLVRDLAKGVVQTEHKLLSELPEDVVQTEDESKTPF